MSDFALFLIDDFGRFSKQNRPKQKTKQKESGKPDSFCFVFWLFSLA
jgi:hypothetical protein